MAKTKTSAAQTSAASSIQKMPKKQADEWLATGILNQDQYDDLVKRGVVTDGSGGGQDVFKQFADGGVKKENIAALKTALTNCNADLWNAKNEYTGGTVRHNFSKKEKNADGSEKKVKYEADAQIEAAVWCKHYEVESK